MFQILLVLFRKGFWKVTVLYFLGKKWVTLRNININSNITVATQVLCVTRFDQSEYDFVEWFSRLKGAFFRGVYGKTFALFQACVGNFDTIPPWKVFGTLYLDSSYVTFKYFAFFSVCDKFELLGHVQAAMMIWVLFSPFFVDSLLVTLSGFIGFSWSSCYFNLSSCKFWDLPVMRCWKYLGMTRSSQSSSTTPGKQVKKTCRSGSRREARNAKSRKSLFYFKPEKVKKFEYCNNLWKHHTGF